MVTAQIEKKWRRELRRANAHGLNNEARVSVHEAGHSLCHWLLPGAERFMRVNCGETPQGKAAEKSERREVAQLLAEAGRTCQTLLRYRKCALQKIALELYARKTLKYRDMHPHTKERASHEEKGPRRKQPV
uniref:Peptidase_M41 domain-containing protein n=1 Tax=Globodera pallida TaxID=36090 RepID=A0A183CF85_GLOPA